MLSLQSFPRKGASLGYVGRIYNLKDLKATCPMRIPFSWFCCNPLYRGEGLDVIRKEARSFCRTIAGVRLCLELEEPNRSPLAACREPSALEGWILEVLHCNLKGNRAFLWIIFTERRDVRLCWELEGPKGPNGLAASRLHWRAESLRSFIAIRKDAADPFCGRARCSPLVGFLKT